MSNFTDRMDTPEDNNIRENEFIRSGKKNYKKLMESIAQLKDGRCQPKTLIEEDN